MSWWNIGLNVAKLVANVVTNLPVANEENGTEGATRADFQTGGVRWKSLVSGKDATGAVTLKTFAQNVSPNQVGINYAVDGQAGAKSELLVINPGVTFDVTRHNRDYQNGDVTICDAAGDEPGTEGTPIQRAISFSMRTVALGTAFSVAPGFIGEFGFQNGLYVARLRFERSPISLIGIFTATNTEGSSVSAEASYSLPTQGAGEQGAGQLVFYFPPGFQVPSILERVSAQLTVDEDTFNRIAEASAHLKVDEETLNRLSEASAHQKV